MSIALRQNEGILSRDLSVTEVRSRDHSHWRIIGHAGVASPPRDQPLPGGTTGMAARKTLDSLSDEMLFEAYRAGDKIAYHELIRRYSNELLHFLTRFLGSRASAEDVFQETFLQIHLSAESFDTSRRFKPWLFTIAANKARDYHRKYSRRTTISLSNSVDAKGEGTPFVDLLESDIPSPDCPLVDSERSSLVKAVVDSLPGHLREILLLSYFQQMSYNQVADSLEIPLGTVKSRLHTAVAAFARVWKAARARDEQRDEISDQRKP